MRRTSRDQNTANKAWGGGVDSNVRRALSITFVATLLSCGIVKAQEQNANAIQKLAFLKGSWHCVVQGAKVPAGDEDHLSYEFAPDWSWMIERSDLREKRKDYWGVQLWGYDAQRKRLVAYQFGSAGVFTKSVDGWVDGRFQSKRDNDGTMVSILPIDQNRFDWEIESPDHSYKAMEVCTR
jgi:hypothetical protein